MLVLLKNKLKKVLVFCGIRLKKFLFNLVFYLLFILLTAGMFLFFLVPMLVFRVIAGERTTLKVLRSLIRIYGWIVVRILLFPCVKVVYKDAAPEKKKRACVYVCNHRAGSDAFLMTLLNCELVQVVNNWPFKIPVLGWVARWSGYLSIRTMPFDEFFQKACRLLEQGVSIAAFPEGVRSTSRTMQQFNGAVFRVAQAARVPIVPLCVTGNDLIPEKGSNILHPGTIKLHKLPALEWDFYKDMPPFKLKNEVRERIQAEFDRMELL